MVRQGALPWRRQSCDPCKLIQERQIRRQQMLPQRRVSHGRSETSGGRRCGRARQGGTCPGTLIIVAAVANLPLAMANVALPSIGAYFDASQTQLNLVAVGYSLGLACSVLWLGALGDRYGRKLMLLLGVTLAMPGRADQRALRRRSRY